MKLLFVLSISILSFQTASAQYQETYQPDSIYKKNAVKARILMYNKNRGRKQIILYDDKGRNIESIHVDFNGRDYTSKIVSQYDSTGNLVNQYSVSYFKVDSIDHKMIIDKLNPDTNIINLEFDSLKRVVKKTCINSKGKKYLETYYANDPLSKTVNRDFNGKYTGCIHETTAIYEAPNISKRVFGYQVLKDSSREKFDFSYENIFDSSGRLKRRLAGKTDPATNELDKSQPFSEITYQYNSGGLLIRQTTISTYNNQERKSIILFDYKFW